MKFKFDENLPTDLGEILRKDGHDDHSVHDESLSGATDRTIAKVCQDERRILITLDLDSAQIQNFPPQEYHGIIVLRLVRQDRDRILALIPRLLALLQTEPIERRLWTMDEHRTRIRGEA